MSTGSDIQILKHFQKEIRESMAATDAVGKNETSLDEIETRAKRRNDKPMLRLIKEIRARNKKVKNKLHEGSGPPKVGDDIYVPSQWYIDRGEDDVQGGLVEVVEVKKDCQSRNLEDYRIAVAEIPGIWYYWNYLKENQVEWKKEYKSTRAHPDPDNG